MTLAFQLVRGLLWLGLCGWLGLVTLNWLINQPENVMQQCALASQAAAVSVIGYALARALDKIVCGIEASLKEYRQ